MHYKSFCCVWLNFLFFTVSTIFELKKGVNHHLKLPKICPCEPQVVPRWTILPILSVRMWEPPIGVRIVGLQPWKNRRLPIQRWVLSVKGQKSWLVFLNQKMLYSLYWYTVRLKTYLYNVFINLFLGFSHQKTTEQRKGQISNCHRAPVLPDQNEATQADHYECVLPAAGGLSDWKQLPPEIQETLKGRWKGRWPWAFVWIR